ncbi:MAG: cupin domain-containing protein [Alphaproteobacteria bacterium]|nr:cupin domain-containing protein [Alphaproteobacteria bacterium]
MKSVEVSPEEMAARTARFSELRPYSDQHDESSGIPAKAMEKLTAHRVYPVMVPEEYTGRSAMAPVKAGERVVLAIAECPPGDGPGLHNHEITTESFFCLQGKFEVTWGDNGEHMTVLEPMDFVSVPQGVMRAFRNISDETGRLFVTIELGEPGSNDRVAYHPNVADELEEEFGEQTVETLKKIGFKFDGGVAG